MPPQDAELQRLKYHRDQAKAALEQAHSALNDASNYRNNIQNVYGGRYEYLKGAIPNKKENMRYNFEQASYWWNNGNKSAASDFSQAGKRLKEELQEMYAEKEEALDELKAAGEQFREALDEYRACKAEFEAARDAVARRYDELKAENERKRKQREAQDQERERQRQQQRQRRDQEREQQRLDETRERQRRWQHVQAQRQSFVELAKARAAQKREQEFKENVGPRRLQSRNEDFTVKVKSGWDKDTGQIITDILIFPRGAKDHLHIGLDEYGNEVFSEWNPNH